MLSRLLRIFVAAVVAFWCAISLASGASGDHATLLIVVGLPAALYAFLAARVLWRSVNGRWYVIDSDEVDR